MSDVDDVQMLGVRQVVQERDDQQRVHPPEHAGEHRRMRIDAAEHLRDAARDDLLGPERGGSSDELAGVRQQQRHHQAADHAENDQRVGVLELVALEAARMQHQPAIKRETRSPR